MVLMLIAPMNTRTQRTERHLQIMNQIALAFAFGSMVVDTIKMVFVQDLKYDKTTRVIQKVIDTVASEL